MGSKDINYVILVRKVECAAAVNGYKVHIIPDI